MPIFILFFIFMGCTSRMSEDLLSIEEKGDLAYARREYQTAVTIWTDAYSKNENNILLANKISDAYFKLGKIDKSEFFLIKANQIDPENITTIMNLAQIYILSWKLPEAEKLCDFLAERKIDDPELDLIRADISLMANELSKAETYYKKAVFGSKDSLRALMKLAVFFKASGRNEEAEELFQRVQKNKELSIQIQLLTADYYLLENQYEKAQKTVLEAIRTEPEDINLKYYLVKLYLAEENNKKAEELLESIPDNKNDKYHRLLIADVYILNNRFDEAEKIISELKKEISEPLADFELLQGKFWLYSGKSIYAAAHFKAAIDLKPGLLNARYILGLTYLINGKAKLSENSLTKALQISPNHYKTLLLISEILYKKEEYDLSLGYLERLIKEYPADFTGRILKGLNFIGQKKYDSAKEAFSQSLYLSKNKVHTAYYYLGLTEELSGNDKRAISYYQKVLDINPELIDAAYRYCLLLVKTKQNRVADDFIRQSLSDGQESSEKYYIAGKIALLTDRKSEGEAYLKKAAAFQDAQGLIYMELADYYQKEGMFEKTIEVLKECISKKPDFPDAWIKLSAIYVDGLEMSKALETMQAGENKFTGLPVYQSNLAWLMLENHQDTDKAFEIAQSAYEKNPDNAASTDTLGWAYYHKGIYSRAAWMFSEAEKKDPDNGFIQYHLGMTYYRQGEIEKALNYLKTAEQSKEAKFFSQQIQDMLGKLSGEKPVGSGGNRPGDIDESILAPPEMGEDEENVISPQWKQ